MSWTKEQETRYTQLCETQKSAALAAGFAVDQGLGHMDLGISTGWWKNGERRGLVENTKNLGLHLNFWGAILQRQEVTVGDFYYSLRTGFGGTSWCRGELLSPLGKLMEGANRWVVVAVIEKLVFFEEAKESAEKGLYQVSRCAYCSLTTHHFEVKREWGEDKELPKRSCPKCGCFCGGPGGENFWEKYFVGMEQYIPTHQIRDPKTEKLVPWTNK